MTDPPQRAAEGRVDVPRREGDRAPVDPDVGAPCPECGAEGVGGLEGCNALFQEVVGREFSQPELFQVHRLSVDAYSLQHPARYMKSAKSTVAHLLGMCWAMEGQDGPHVARAMSRFLDGGPPEAAGRTSE